MSLAAIPQLILNGLMAGAILTTPAIGFTAIYAVLRFPNFAVASHATIGAFAGYVANATLHLPLLPSAAAASSGRARAVHAASGDVITSHCTPSRTRCAISVFSAPANPPW